MASLTFNRLVIAAAMLFAGFDVQAAEPYCVTDRDAFACQTSEQVGELQALALQNPKLMIQTLDRLVSRHACERLFEALELTGFDRKLSSGQMQVRRGKRTDTLWMVKNFAKPGTCSTVLAALYGATTQRPPAQPLVTRKQSPPPAEPDKPACVYKGSMSDAEIAACRQQ